MSYTDMISHANNESKYELLINGNLNVENAVLLFKNFAGEPTRVNPAGGKRTFNLVLNQEYAEKLHAQSWNVKAREVKDQIAEDERALTVNFDTYMQQHQGQFDHVMFFTEIVVNENSEFPPKIYKVSEFNGEKTMAIIPPDQWYRLDKEQLMNVDLVIHPYTHGRSIANPDAKKGYLKTLYAMAMPVNDFNGKYAGYTIAGE